jgi:glycosyltransferase involved in cell wall biosynthesis
MKPLISIIIPTYQRCSKLKIALESVLSQTYENYEILIMDDGSKDGTKEMVHSFKDDRIIYNWQNNTGSPAKARNRGIKAARGEWVAFLDSDDWWTFDKLKNCMHHNNNQVDFIYHDVKIVSKNQDILKRKMIKTRQLKNPVLIDLLLSGNMICNSSVIVRRNLLISVGSIDERKELVAVEDYHTWLKIAKLTDKFFYIPQSLGFYLEHNQNLSKKDMSIPSRIAIQDFKEILTKKQNLKLEANIKYKSGRFYYLNNNFEKSKKDLIYVLKYGYYFLKLRSLLMLFNMLIK